MAESVNADDDIVAGPSKMSLKCPVSDSPLRLRSCGFLNCRPAELHEGGHTLSFLEMCALTMFRCNFLVFDDGTDHHVVMPCMREAAGLQGIND